LIRRLAEYFVKLDASGGDADENAPILDVAEEDDDDDEW